MPFDFRENVQNDQGEQTEIHCQFHVVNGAIIPNCFSNLTVFEVAQCYLSSLADPRRVGGGWLHWASTLICQPVDETSWLPLDLCELLDLSDTLPCCLKYCWLCITHTHTHFSSSLFVTVVDQFLAPLASPNSEPIRILSTRLSVLGEYVSWSSADIHTCSSLKWSPPVFDGV